MLISRTPDNASCRVRGIGVAVSVSTWTSALSCFSFSFCDTPKCCSSSMTSRPRWANRTSLASSAWVPIDDVEAALGEFLFDLARVLGGDQPRQLRDAHRQPGEALGEVAVMLARQQRRRHHDRDLAAGHRRDKGGAQRDLGLAEADIAADQPVHRPARGHVGQGVGDRVQLVFGLGIGKARGEFLVEPFGRRHDLARPQLALGGDPDQLAGDIADALLDPRLARLPGDPAEPVELRPGLLGAEARQHLDVLDRDEQLVVAGIEHAQAVMRRAGDVDRLQRLVAADAVIGMDDEIARRQGRRLGDELVEIAPPPRRCAPAGRRECPARRARRACRS